MRWRFAMRWRFVHWRLLLREITELETQMRGAVVTPAGRLRVDVPAAFGRHVLMPALPEFLARYPEINIEVGSTDRPSIS